MALRSNSSFTSKDFTRECALPTCDNNFTTHRVASKYCSRECTRIAFKNTTKYYHGVKSEKQIEDTNEIIANDRVKLAKFIMPQAFDMSPEAIRERLKKRYE